MTMGKIKAMNSRWALKAAAIFLSGSILGYAASVWLPRYIPENPCEVNALSLDSTKCFDLTGVARMSAENQGAAIEAFSLSFSPSGDAEDAEPSRDYRSLLKAARLGLPEAQFALGSEFLEVGSSEATALGVRWLEEAAAQDFGPAIARLGFHHISSDELVSARRWLEDERVSDDPNVLGNLAGLLLRQEIGDFERAIETLKKAIEKGHEPSKISLLMMVGPAESPYRDEALARELANRIDMGFAETVYSDERYLTQLRALVALFTE